jgi:predicted O-methyltransferase YrrM
MEISRLIDRTPLESGVRIFSPPMAFDMPEEEYERRIGSHAGMAEGEGVFRLFCHFGGNPNGVALELGAGGGAATIGFVAASRRMHTIVTDPSPAFLRIIREKLERAQLSSQNITLGTLLGEEISRMPVGSLDLIFLAASLHHVLDYKRFLSEAAVALKPGGLLIFQEPFSEGFLLMAMAAEVMLRFDTKLYVLKSDDRQKLHRMLEALYFQSNRRLAKEQHEDKHCFLTDELMSACAQSFSQVRFLRNQALATIGTLKAIEEIDLDSSSRASITGYMRSFLVDHFQISEAAAGHYDRHVAPVLQNIDWLYMQGDGPAFVATVICRK